MFFRFLFNTFARSGLLLMSALASSFAVLGASNPEQLLIGFKPSATFADRASAMRRTAEAAPLDGAPGRQKAGLGDTQIALVTLQNGVSAASEMARLERIGGVAYVEPNYRVSICATNPPGPTDFHFYRQHALQNLGLNGARTNADISATKAWALTTGASAIVVAVIDTGIDYLHEDLRDNIWRNEREIPNNGLDDDGNGFVDDAFGYDFVSRDSDPFDDNNHGTHVAGIVGARGNNGLGIAGVCWQVSLMPVKTLDEDGNGTVADAIAGIHYAVRNGARIINASWALGEKSRALEEAAQFAADSGVLFVAAAGNSRTDAPTYPAAFDSVLAVAASDERDNRAPFSNFGPAVDLAAPGMNIFSTLPENRYGLESGTSMAAPHASGVAALVLARFPFYNRQELFDILVNSVDPVLFDQPVGSGRLNASLAVRMDQPLPLVRLVAPATLSGRGDIRGTALGRYFAGYLLRAGSGTYPTNWIEIASSVKPVTNDWVGAFDSSLLPDGFATLQLVVTNQNGLTASASASVRLLNALITAPLSGDVLPPGKYPVRGTVFGLGKSYELSVGRGLEPKSWTVIATGAATQSTNALLGEWDASGAPAGMHALRLLVDTGEAAKFEFVAPAIYIDRQLRPGWPAYLPVDRDFPPSDWRNVRVADLDGDGSSELVLVDPANRNRPQKIFVYSARGELLWSRTLGFDIPPDLPVMGDMDGDGKKEIFVDGTNGIVALRHDGSDFGPGWPVATRGANHAKVLADLDLDGRLELIAYSQEYSATQVGELRELAVYRGDGSLVRKWDLPWCGFTNAVQKIAPAVANIDDDPELEIVVVSGCSEIAAYDYRRLEPKWRAFGSSTFLSTPVIGDIDGRNGPDIVVAAAIENGAAQGGVHVFDGKGTRWLGWPVLEDHSFLTAPALADLDGDGRLEMIATSFKPAALHVLQWDGFEAEGWPREITHESWHGSVAAADLDGDLRPDVVFTSPGYVNLAVLQNEYRYVGGIAAFDFEGRQIALSGSSEFKPLLIESATARWHRAGPAVICDLDNDGWMDVVTASILDRTFGSYTRVKDRSSIYAWNLDLPYRDQEAPWPMFGHDARNTSAYSLPFKPGPTPTNATLAARDRVITIEDRPVQIEPLLNDWNRGGGQLQLAGVSQPTNGAVQMLDGGVLRYSPATNFSGFDEFSYRILDQEGNASTGRVVIRVKPANDRPVAKNLTLEMIKNTNLDVFFEADDAENDPLTFRVVTTPGSGELWNYPTLGAYFPKKGFYGVDYFSYVATDGKLESEPAVVTVSIINSNNPPKAIAMELLTKTNRSLRIGPRGEDPDGDPLTFELVRKPLNGTAVPEGNGFRFTPDKDFVGDDSMTFRAYDGSAFGEPAAIKIGVIATNAAPRAGDGSAEVQPNSTNEFRLGGSDPDGDAVEFVVLTQPAHGTLTGTAPTLIYAPEPGYLGPDRFTFKVTDSFAESEPATFSINIARANRPPVANDQIVAAPQNAPLPIALDAFDPDGDAVRTIILKGPTYGLIYGVGTNFTYVPQASFTGTDNFTYKLWDGQRFGNAGRVSVSIEGGAEQKPFQFSAIRRAEEAIELVIRPGAASGYTLQSSTNLADWLPLSGPWHPNAEAQTHVDTNAIGPRRYYRAIAE